jgi:hypothetical protein
MIEKRVNIINNHKYVTIHYGEDKTKQRNFIEQSESICFLSLEKNIVKSMVLHFKIDENCNVYLLYCVNIEFKKSNFK